jgi:hypothetical protein
MEKVIRCYFKQESVERSIVENEKKTSPNGMPLRSIVQTPSYFLENQDRNLKAYIISNINVM